jgi:hypothetical protein
MSYVFIGSLLVICLLLTIMPRDNVELFAPKPTDPPTLINTIGAVDDEIVAELTNFQFPEMLSKGAVTVDTTISDAEKIGRCTGIMDFKNRLLQKIKDIVGAPPSKA